MHNEPNDETRITSARILPNSLLCVRLFVTRKCLNYDCSNNIVSCVVWMYWLCIGSGNCQEI